jgi:hypothetical protein
MFEDAADFELGYVQTTDVREINISAAIAGRRIFIDFSFALDNARKGIVFGWRDGLDISRSTAFATNGFAKIIYAVPIEPGKM